MAGRLRLSYFIFAFLSSSGVSVGLVLIIGQLFRRKKKDKDGSLLLAQLTRNKTSKIKVLLSCGPPQPHVSPMVGRFISGNFESSCSSMFVRSALLPRVLSHGWRLYTPSGVVHIEKYRGTASRATYRSCVCMRVAGVPILSCGLGR